MEKVSIPEDLEKVYYESMNGSKNVLMMVQVNNDVAVVVDDGYSPIEKPSVLPPEAEDFLSNLGLDLVSPEECPGYELDL